MSFSDNTIKFLVENCMHDSKEWYQQHKEDYTEYVVKPFTELVNSLCPVFSAIDSRLICTPKKISRLYRDTRFSKGGSIFRDTVWCSFGHSKEFYWGLPGYFFELSPREFRYGMGYYYASANSMSAVRKLILNNTSTWQQALKTYENQSVYELCGDTYKKNHYPEAKQEETNWLNRKTLCLIHQSNDFDILFSDKLSDIISSDFMLAEPIYNFLMIAEDTLGCCRTE